MKTTLPVPLQPINVDQDALLNFEKSVLLKDYSPEKIKKAVPKLSTIIDLLISTVPQNKYITVDVMMHNFMVEGKTCTDTSPHIDGIGNEYVIWSVGDFRTEFLTTSIEVLGLGELEPRSIQSAIKESLRGKNLEFAEAPNSVPMRYDSLCIHRGRKASAGSKRIMVRVCSSSYLAPRNANLTNRR